MQAHSSKNYCVMQNKEKNLIQYVWFILPGNEVLILNIHKMSSVIYFLRDYWNKTEYLTKFETVSSEIFHELND